MMFEMLIMFVLLMLEKKILQWKIEMIQVIEQVFVKYHHQKIADIQLLNQVRRILNLENILLIQKYFQILSLNHLNENEIHVDLIMVEMVLLYNHRLFLHHQYVHLNILDMVDK